MLKALHFRSRSKRLKVCNSFKCAEKCLPVIAHEHKI